MANLKSNGTEVRRYVRRRERNDGNVLRDTTYLSERSNGWMLRKHVAVIVDVYHPKGYRLVTRGWRRWYKVTDDGERTDLIENGQLGFEVMT